MSNSRRSRWRGLWGLYDGNVHLGHLGACDAAPFTLKDRFQLLALVINIGPHSIELVAVTQHLPHILVKMLQAAIFPSVQFCFDGAQIHRLFHNLWIMGNVFSNRIHWYLKVGR